MNRLSILIIVLALLNVTLAMAQAPVPSQSKHPRVLDVEKMVAKEGLNFLQARFPGKPFIVAVSIDALHRTKSGEKSDLLPYYDVAPDDVFDEWSEPSVPNTLLLTRVKKIQVTLTVPAELSEDELTEIKESMMTTLGLISTRDQIEIRKRNWNSLPEKKEDSLANIIAFSLITLFALVTLGLIAFFTSHKLAQAIRESGPKQPADGQLSAGASSFAGPVSTGDSNPLALTAPTVGSPGLGSGGDVKMLDSLRFREHVVRAIELLQKHPDFPRLDDMLIFESFANNHPGEFGAFLSEMPYEMRMRVFGFSYSVAWLKAMAEPTDTGPLTLEIIQRCVRVQRNEQEFAWQNLLILVWRLQNQSSKFFQGMDPKDAMTILAHLPKGDAVRLARQLFPGSWSPILDPSFRPEPLSEIAIKKETLRALQLVPLRKPDLIEKYRTEKEILNYVRLAPASEEREVYLAAGSDSTLYQARPPFYPFFELSKEQYLQLLPKHSLEEWAAALYDTPKAERQRFEEVLSNRQRSRLYEIFRKLDQKGAPAATLARIREKIGVEISSELLNETEKPSLTATADEISLAKKAS
jgi:hypothetical protein